MKRDRGRYGLYAALIAGSIALSLPVFGAESEIERVMKERHEKFELMGEAYDSIDLELKRDNPDLALIQEHAVQIDEWAGELIYWFPEGSGPDSGIKTEAKAEIWSDPDDFEALQEAFVVEARNLRNASAESNMETLGSRFKATSAVCSECHEKYRKETSLFSIFGF